MNREPGSKKSHSFAGFDQWQNEFPGYSFRYFTVTHESLLEIIGWPDGLTDELFESFTPFLIGLSLDIVPLPAPVAASSSAGEDRREKRRKMKRPLPRNYQRNVLLLPHLSLLRSEEDIVVVVPQERVTSVDVPKVDVTLLVSLVPVISTALFVRVRRCE